MEAYKIDAAHTIIEMALKKSEAPVVSCSFGKDSLVVLHLVREVERSIPVLWNDTGVEYPEIHTLVALLKKQWNLAIIIAKPNVTFWEIVQIYGFPTAPRHSKTKARMSAWHCCEKLKKLPFYRATKYHGFDLSFDGLTMWESSSRRFLLDTNFPHALGPYRYVKKPGIWKCSPISTWTPADVWDYIKRNKIPYPPLYDKEAPELDPGLTRVGYRQGNTYRALRIGCWTCTMTMDHGKIAHLRTFYPRLWTALLRKGAGKLILQKKTGDPNATQEQAETLMETNPCYFDK